jgi:hypothetical protein
MPVKLLQSCTIMLYALVAGVLWGTRLSLGRTMARYDAAVFLADFHTLPTLLSLAGLAAATLDPLCRSSEEWT